MSILVVFLFSAYVFLESASITPRMAGAFVGANGMGYAFSSMLNTVKRIFIVAYPPVLGWLAISGESLFPTIFVSYIFGCLALLVTYYFRFGFVVFFAKNISAYSEGASLISIFFGSAACRPDLVSEREDITGNINLKLVATSSWIYFIYGSSMFIVNILADHFRSSSAVIYQLAGLINALGTLLMSFVLDPIISRNFDHGKNLWEIYYSIILGQLVSYCILGPGFIWLLYIYLS